jgi:hypothetical protein
MIKTTHLILLTGMLLFSGLYLVPASVCGTDLKRFIDFDGDGFGDLAPDSDLDGIPDEFEAHGFLSAATNGDLQAVKMFSVSLQAGSSSEANKITAFGKREFATRGICITRSDFDSGFSSGLGLGGGVGGGGACAGGICY